METFENLLNLPKEVRFPKHLKDRILYDATKCLLVFKGIMSKQEKKELQRLSRDKSYRATINVLFHNSRRIQERLEKLEKEITKYGEIFVEFPDVWNERRLIEYIKIRTEDLSDMRRLYKEGLQATLKESRTVSVGIGAGSSEKTEPSTPQAPAKVAEGLILSPQERFRHKSTFLAEVELQRLVEGRDDNTLLRGYGIYLLRFLISVVPGKRYNRFFRFFFPFKTRFDSRNAYAEVTVRIGLPGIEDLKEEEMRLIKKEDIKEWEEKLKDIEKRRKPYIFNFIPQEYVQHIGALSAIGTKFGLDLAQPSTETQTQSPSPAEEKGKSNNPTVKTGPLWKLFSGAPQWQAMPASLRSAYEAQSEAVLSHQTLIAFMRDEDEVGWLFGPRFVGPGRQVPEKGVRQVYVLAAIPGELPMVKLTMSTNWVNIKDHSKRAYDYLKVCELLEQYNSINNEIDEITQHQKISKSWKDIIVSKVCKVYSLMPFRTGKLFLPCDEDKACRADESKIGDIKPKVTSIHPDSGPSDVETQVLIKGENFDLQTRVEMDGKDIHPVTLINREVLITTMPSIKDGPKTTTIRVVTPIGISDPTDKAKFKYTSPVTVSRKTSTHPTK